MFQCPHGLELLPTGIYILEMVQLFQCPHGLELLPTGIYILEMVQLFQCPHGLELLLAFWRGVRKLRDVSMPSWA